MRTTRCLFFIFTKINAAPTDFVAYWSATYSYKMENLYTDNINGQHTPETLGELFRWKIGERFARAHMPTVEHDFILRMYEAPRICTGASAAEFLEAFPCRYAIYRIYWAHCWQPKRFPIHDQHVHRAMTFT